MKRTEIKVILEQASKLGTQAFNDGKKSAPFLDSNIMEMVKKYQDSEVKRMSIKIMEAWSKAWHTANAKAAWC